MEEKPKVAATGIAGGLGALAVWGWNVWREIVADAANATFPSEMYVPDPWILEEPYSLLAVAILAFLVGPLIRKYERWSSK